MARATLNPNLREFWQTPARNRVLYGGRASSKSWDAAGVSLFTAQAQSKKIMCVRQIQNRIEDSVYTLLKNRIKDFGFSASFNIQRKTILCPSTGSSFVFYGLYRHIEEIKSAEGIDILWIEEAHNLTKDQWEILEPTIRKEGSQIWVIFNPKLATDFAYKRFVLDPPPNTVVRKINYDENPFLSQTMLDIIATKQNEDLDGFNHIYGGEPVAESDRVLVKRAWLKAAIDAHIKLGIEIGDDSQIGFDVADIGDDKNAEGLRRGIVFTHVDEWDGAEDELLASSDRVYDLALSTDSVVAYDSIGMGAYVGSRFKERNDKPDAQSVRYGKFNASGEVRDKKKPVDKGNPQSPLNGHHFSNLKAQVWFGIARRFLNTYNAVTKGIKYPESELISISSDCGDVDGLIDELSAPRQDRDAKGKVKVESKEDLEKRNIASPNKADAFIMAYAPVDIAYAGAMYAIV